MKRLKTLRVRFALWTAGLLLAALILFGLFVYINMSRSLARAADEMLRLAALQLIAEVETGNGEVIYLEESAIAANQYAQLRKQGFSLRVLNLTGQSVQASGPYRDLPQPQIDLTGLNHSGQFTTITDSSSQDPVRVYTSLMIDDNQVVGILQVAQNLKDVRRTLSLLLLSLLVGGPLIVIVTSSSGYFLAARALAPIDEITRTAGHISGKDLSARLNLPETDDEVGRLGATFDSMLIRLDNAFRRERQFIADASHELRTPLAAMQTIIGSTLTRQRPPAEYERALIDLSQEVEQMRTLTEGLLLLAHHDAIRQPTKFEWVNLSILLKDVIASLHPLAADKGLTLIDHIPDNELTLRGDSDELIRLFANLLDNAIKYTVQGSITLSAKPRDGKLLAVTVSDTGIGIPPEHLPHIFDRFYRVDEARSGQGGSGLGLAIALNIAHVHGGEITVESKIGKGSTFIIHLGIGIK